VPIVFVDGAGNGGIGVLAPQEIGISHPSSPTSSTCYSTIWWESLYEHPSLSTTSSVGAVHARDIVAPTAAAGSGYCSAAGPSQQPAKKKVLHHTVTKKSHQNLNNLSRQKF
jgi:hypothetical protein